MKTRRLSESDLARFCAETNDDHLRELLRSYNRKGGSWSYEPFKRSQADILGASVPAFISPDRPSDEQLEKQIRRLCRHGTIQETANLEVAFALRRYSENHGWKSVTIDHGKMPLGFGEYVKYWSNAVIDDGSGLLICYFDERRKNGISNKEQRKFVYSMQNTWIRERNLDLQDARLAVINFIPQKESGRLISINIHDQEHLHNYDDLNENVKRVYRIWAEVCHERSGTERHAAAMGSTLF